jgi:hypothetical protein
LRFNGLVDYQIKPKKDDQGKQGQEKVFTRSCHTFPIDGESGLHIFGENGAGG